MQMANTFAKNLHEGSLPQVPRRLLVSAAEYKKLVNVNHPCIAQSHKIFLNPQPSEFVIQKRIS